MNNFLWEKNNFLSTGLEISNCNCPYFFLCRTLLKCFFMECYLTPSLGQLNTLTSYGLETCLGMIICFGARYLLGKIFEVVTPTMCVEYFSAICFLPIVAPLLVLQNCAFGNMLGAFLVHSIFYFFCKTKFLNPNYG